ncbi:MAG: hypothetical protein L3K26_00850 [Candidatus Hydrogenedentes bacterium]|nr:hypothetical protein [Candidatus Hydrogenedentota bacterium]
MGIPPMFLNDGLTHDFVRVWLSNTPSMSDRNVRPPPHGVLLVDTQSAQWAMPGRESVPEFSKSSRQ